MRPLPRVLLLVVLIAGSSCATDQHPDPLATPASEATITAPPPAPAPTHAPPALVSVPPRPPAEFHDLVGIDTPGGPLAIGIIGDAETSIDTLYTIPVPLGPSLVVVGHTALLDALQPGEPLVGHTSTGERLDLVVLDSHDSNAELYPQLRTLADRPDGPWLIIVAASDTNRRRLLTVELRTA